MTDLPQGRMLLVGCGNMGGAMLRRWIAAGLDPAQVTVVSPSGRSMPDGVRVVTAVPSADAGAPFDIVMLGFKPQQLGLFRDGPLAGHAPRLLLSILAGVEHDPIAAVVPRAVNIVRAMPNLPVAIGKGVVALNTVQADDAARATAAALMRPLGHIEWIAVADQFDDVTALAGCGPGFVFRFADALAQAGAALGLPADQAARLALATLQGAAMMAAEATDTPHVLADRVASPGGSTRAGLNVLDRPDGLVALLTDTLAASARRNREMAAAAREG
ncbi:MULTISPECIES: pyrroline-5-carboxylate reductase [unclassified Sphingomonas]|uniref:pyrroline-5-carboxylate reductase family protein n=1 Tax=unclassified Sphingomonas TaxID=196159 RepID=UPI001E3431E1|nr:MULTISPECIES: pyrroline-5-carboxylate reductase dimerization domain-containing protein [unclassified Sphingomonas]